MGLSNLQKLDKQRRYWQKCLYQWFVIPLEQRNERPWQAMFLITRKLRGIVAMLIALTTVGTGITVFIFLFPFKLSQCLPILQILLGVFFVVLLLFIHFQRQGDRFHLKFLEEVRLRINDGDHTFIPLDKRKILRQFEWYSKRHILKANFIALGLALIFITAPQKVMNVLKPRQESLTEVLQARLLKKHQQIAYLRTVNEQSEQIIIQAERLVRHNQRYIKRLRKGMHKHYRQIIELRRYLRHINRVGYQLGQLKKAGHTEVWKQEKVVRSNKVVIGHVKGLVQAKLEQKAQSKGPYNGKQLTKQAEGILNQQGVILKKYRELRVRYRKLERRTNHFSYRNSQELKKARKQITVNQQLNSDVCRIIQQRDSLIRDIAESIKLDERKLQHWQKKENQKVKKNQEKGGI